MAIKIMSEDLSNKIAAGEVVERPRSIVKELVENALDAGATEIQIKIKESGIREIMVEDNGKGMDEHDALLAFQRHATSKIFSEADLFAIHTLGFRGEALAAIASVSKVHLHTGMKNTPSTHITIHGGEIILQESDHTKEGTRITISGLFYNTPARLKHLKSLQTEYAHILEYLQKMALARPDVRFEFSSDDKIVFKTYGTNKLADTLVMIYGDKLARYLFPVEIADNDFSITGMISHPQMQRSNNRVINLSVNNRSVRNYGINRAILSGYGNLMPKGMYPIVAINIEIDTKLVDVNVHPAKLEVRISQERQLEALVQKMVKDTLARENLIFQDVALPKKVQRAEQFSFTYNEEQETSAQTIGYPNMKNTTEQYPKRFDKTTLNVAERDIAKQVYEMPNIELATQIIAEEKAEYVVKPTVTVDEPVSDNSTIEVTVTPTDSFTEARAELQELAIIGQFNATFILAQRAEMLYLIDQHAAQERIKYDEHMKHIRGVDKIVTQELLFPLTIFLETRDLQAILTFKEELAKNGIDFEEFATQEIRINSVPAWIKKENIELYVRKAIDCVLTHHAVDSALIREKELIMLSCKYSIKAHDVLNLAEMQHLLKQLSHTETPFTCPHGRPIIVKHTLYEVERWFKRV